MKITKHDLMVLTGLFVGMLTLSTTALSDVVHANEPIPLEYGNTGALSIGVIPSPYRIFTVDPVINYRINEYEEEVIERTFEGIHNHNDKWAVPFSFADTWARHLVPVSELTRVYIVFTDGTGMLITPTWNDKNNKFDEIDITPPIKIHKI